MPKVSVIIPTYNRQHLLKRAILSILSQTLKDYEILVVQNGPIEHSKALVEEFRVAGIPIRYLYESKPDSVNARNIGIKNAFSEYVALLDDDDEWLSEKLEKQVALLDTNPQIGLVACQAPIFIELENGNYEMRQWQGFISFKRLFISGCVIRSLSCVLVRRECFDQIGFFNPSFSITNDYEFYLRLLQKYLIYILKESLVKYHRHDQNLTTDVEKMASETMAVLKSFRNYHVDSSVHARRNAKRSLESCGVSPSVMERTFKLRGFLWRAKLFHAVADDAMDSGQYGRAYYYFFRAILKDPAIGKKIKWNKYKNPMYRFLRPYTVAIYCVLKHLHYNIVLKQKKMEHV